MQTAKHSRNPLNSCTSMLGVYAKEKNALVDFPKKCSVGSYTSFNSAVASAEPGQALCLNQRAHNIQRMQPELV